MIDYFFSVNPGAVVFTSYEYERLRHKRAAGAIVNDPRFRHYVLVRKYRSPVKAKYCQFVFFREDLLHLVAR